MEIRVQLALEEKEKQSQRNHSSAIETSKSFYGLKIETVC